MPLTRRKLLGDLGLLSGAGVSFAAMQMLGIDSPASAKAARFGLPGGSGAGKKVVILGAGIAGLVAAYELRKADYAVTVLEARQRAGGRAWTIRGKDRIEQIERPLQHANFGTGQYFNAGPARLPSSHHLILSYAERLGIPLEVFVNSNQSAGWDFGGHVEPQRRMVNDMRGLIGEMLFKAMNGNALDERLSKEERDGFRGFLGAYSGLNREGKYVPSVSSGYANWPGGYDHPPTAVAGLTPRQLVPNEAAGFPYFFEQIMDMQATMMQPVGGMDRIAAALYREVAPSVLLGTPVSAIRRDGNGVRVEHKNGVVRADYCVCTLPAPILARIPSDFSPAKRAALKGVEYLKSAKLAFEAPRFWERDDHIYGGLAWTDRLNENVIYPSHGFHSPRGVIVGAYVAGWTHRDTPEAFVKLPIAEQIRISAGSIEALHPGKSRLLTSPVAINWGQVPYSEGVGAIGRDFGEEKRGAAYDELCRPEGPIAFAGEHLSYVGLWQEGSALSAHEAVKLVHEMATAQKVA
ncbi:MAG: FAD-dependent oxidoreductase [Sphingomicrobium sp.]